MNLASNTPASKREVERRKGRHEGCTHGRKECIKLFCTAMLVDRLDAVVTEAMGGIKE